MIKMLVFLDYLLYSGNFLEFYVGDLVMMGIGFPELMIILVIIMIIFGAGKLPQIGSAFGQSIKNFKSSMKEAEELDASAENPQVEEGEETKTVPETTGEGENDTVKDSSPVSEPAEKK